jgi:hypothetical protein
MVRPTKPADIQGPGIVFVMGLGLRIAANLAGLSGESSRPNSILDNIASPVFLWVDEAPVSLFPNLGSESLGRGIADAILLPDALAIPSVCPGAPFLRGLAGIPLSHVFGVAAFIATPAKA